MGKVAEKKNRLILMDIDESSVRRMKVRGAVLCRGREEIARAMRQVSERSLWISFKQRTTDDVLRNIQECQHRRGRMYGLVTVEPPRPTSVPGLTSCFRRLVGTAPDSKFLPMDELLDVLSAPHAEAAGLFIAGVADIESQTLALTRGNLKTVTIPFSMFQSSATGIEPDFSLLTLDDYGHTVRLGEYEASSDAILYEVDTEYRRKTRKQHQADEKTFGASLRRLRILRRLSRDNFSPLSAKTIARLERNEVEKPHGETLRVIAERLNVEPEEIESY
jgi:hypothetical protein